MIMKYSISSVAAIFDITGAVCGIWGGYWF